MDKIKCHDRARQILELLKLHGPLSFRALNTMIEPPMKKPRLVDSLARLRKKGFIKRRNINVFGNQSCFHQLEQDEDSIKEISNYLKCSSVELYQPFFRYRELLHTEACALWAHALQKMFPEVQIMRDFDFEKDIRASKIMLNCAQDLDVRPDLILIFKKDDHSGEVAIAVEVEKTRKSAKRITQKLKKYSNGTRVDGLIYLCDSHQISGAIQGAYRGQVMQRSKRIGHYAENFLLLGDSKGVHMGSVEKMFNSELKPVHLKKWINMIRSTTRNTRRDKKFDESVLWN